MQTVPGHVSPGHSGRIRYASPQELPSYPSIGLKEDGSAAGAAASLGWANQKPVELWKPSSSSSASAAAHLANDNQRTVEPWKPALSSSAASAALQATDYKHAEPWKPASSSSAASAALLAKDYKMPAIRETERSSAPYQAATLAAASAASTSNSPRQPAAAPRSSWGNSAASQAFNAANAAPRSSQADESYALSRHESLRGARGAVAGSRPRSMSTPQKYTYPDQANASTNAMNAAAASHRASVRSKHDEAGSVPYTNMAREMFTSRPPVKLEVDEKQHADSLHASAVAMAKRMYNQQQKAIDSAKNHAATTAAARSSSFSRNGAGSPGSSDGQTTGFPNLQEAAYRLAQERLAKLHEEHQKDHDRTYQDYYGAPDAPRSAGRLGSIRGRLTRRRSSSDGDLVEDRKRSQQIRQEMSIFNTTLSKVDDEKRTKARQALLAAAQRNVKAQMEGMDQRLYEESGRVPPSRLNDWEMKAHSAALLRVESGRNTNVGKVDLGAGVFMTQEEVNAIAAKRMQPVLDDITQKAEEERERQLAMKLDEEHRKEQAEAEKAREKEIHDIHKKLKDEQKEEEKRVKAEAKAAEKARKEQEKASKAEEKRRAKEEKHKSKEDARPLAQDLKERVAEEDRQDEAEPSTQTAAVVTPNPPVAGSPVEGSPQLAPPAAEASPAEVEESKAKAEEEKAAQREERRRSKFLKKPLALDLRKRHAKDDQPPPATAPLERREPAESPTPQAAAATKERSQSFSGRAESNSSPTDDEPRSGTSKIRNWLSTRFSRPRTKSTASAPTGEDKSSSLDTPAAEERGFIGGAALRRRTNSSSSSSSSASSLRDIAFAHVNRDTTRREQRLPSTTAPAERDASPARSVSPVSSSSSDEEGEEADTFEEARETVARPITPPPAPRDPGASVRLSASPARESRFSEVLD